MDSPVSASIADTYLSGAAIKILSPFTIIDFTSVDAFEYGDIRAELEINSKIIGANEIPQELVAVVHANLLLANFNLNEVTYSIDPEGNIYSENDLPVDSDLITFKSELGAVVFGYQYFYEQLAPQIGGPIEKMSKDKLGIT